MKTLTITLACIAAGFALVAYFRREFKRDERIAQRARDLGIGEEEEPTLFQ